MIAHEFLHLSFESASVILLEKLPGATAVSSGEGKHLRLAAGPLHLDTERSVFIFIRLIGEPGILLHVLIDKSSVRLPQGLLIKRIGAILKYALSQLYFERRQIKYIVRWRRILRAGCNVKKYRQRGKCNASRNLKLIPENRF